MIQIDFTLYNWCIHDVCWVKIKESGVLGNCLSLLKTYIAGQCYIMHVNLIYSMPQSHDSSVFVDYVNIETLDTKAASNFLLWFEWSQIQYCWWKLIYIKLIIMAVIYSFKLFTLISFVSGTRWTRWIVKQFKNMYRDYKRFLISGFHLWRWKCRNPDW